MSCNVNPHRAGGEQDQEFLDIQECLLTNQCDPQKMADTP